MSTLTPLQLIAGASLGNNTSIAVSTNLTSAIDQYRSTSLISPLASTMSNVEIGNILGNSIILTLETLSANNCPPLSDSTPTAYANSLGLLLIGNVQGGNSINGFTGIVNDFGNLYLGTGDNSVFVQVFTAADAYVKSINDYILTTNNSDTYLGSSFTSINSLITGDLDQTNLAFTAFGNDLQQLGLAINLENLNNLGSPLALLQQLSTVAGLTPSLQQQLNQNGIDFENILQPPESLVQLIQLEKTLYAILTQIQKQDLQEILQLLNVSTPNIESLADLLNPVKIFPESFFSLTVRTVNGLRGIYLDQSGSVNNKLLNSLPEYVLSDYRRLTQSIPQDQALANQCLRVSLQQIKNIFNLSLPALAESYLNLATTRDLPLINALVKPVPDSVKAFYTTSFATGTGPEGTLILADLLGAAIGVGYIEPLQNTIAILNSLTNESNFANLTVVYQRMNTTLSGGYGNAVSGPITIPAGPAAGTYTAVGNVTAAANAFSNGLISNAEFYINAFVSNNASSTENLNSNWISMADKLILENNNLANASIEIENLIANQRTAILGFIQNLPTYGLDTQANGSAEFLEEIADKTTLGGQSIVGALRQGRNVAVLDAVGVGTNIEIPNTFNQPPPQVSLTPAEYTEAEAANLVIR